MMYRYSKDISCICWCAFAGAQCECEYAAFSRTKAAGVKLSNAAIFYTGFNPDLDDSGFTTVLSFLSCLWAD